MPLFSSFSASSARSLGLTSGAPPGPPVITSNSSTATTLTIGITPVLGSFEISRFEYSLNGASYTGNISGSATTFQFTGLVPSTSYTVRIRAVDASSQISDVSNQITRSTTAEIPPSAPSVSLTQRESAVGSGGTAINATKLNFSYGVATAGTYPVTSYEYILYRGATLITAAAVPMAPNTNHIIEGLTPGSSHTVYVRAIATANGTTPGDYGSATASTDTEIANSPPSLTITSQDTVNVTFSVSGSTGGTYGVRAYLWLVVRNSDGVWVNSGETTNTSNTVNAGTPPDGSFTIYAAAKSLVSNLQGNNSSVGGQLNPLVPAPPIIYFSSESASERGTAYLAWNAVPYATQYQVFRNGVHYATTGSTSYNVPVSAGSNWNFFVRAGNRLDQFSGNSNTKYMTTGATGVPWSSTVSTARYIQNYGSCVQGDSISSLVIQAPASASNENDAGHYFIEKIGFEGLKTPGGFNFIRSSTRLLYIQKTSGPSPTVPEWSAGKHTINNFALSETTGFIYEWGVYQGGADISNVVFKVTTTLQYGGGWGAFNSGCSPQAEYSVIGRNIKLTGTVVTATTYG
jgi:hypothetical protein